MGLGLPWWCVFQQALEFRVEDVFADQPAPVVGEAGQIFEFAREEHLMIDIISELRL